MELVSVVIPTYNREKTIVRSVESVLTQTYKNLEVIIVDDCSIDKTEELIIKKYKDNSKIKYIKLEKNSGACVARNVGIKNSKGEYIAFLDSDDLFYKDKIEKQVNIMKANNFNLCASYFYRVDKNGNKRIIKTFEGTKEDVYNELLFCNYITTGTLIGKRLCFEEEMFDENMPRYQDWDLVLRLAKKYDICFLKEPTIYQEYQEKSITASTNHKKTYYALNRIYEKNKDGYAKNLRACSQIRWLIGIHSMYGENIPNWKDLWFGATQYKISIKRIFIVFLFKIGLKGILENQI